MAELLVRLRCSERYLSMVKPIIPENLRSLVQAGPLDENGWCLLVRDSAALSKMRQVLPRIRESLIQHGVAITNVRLKLLPRVVES